MTYKLIQTKGEFILDVFVCAPVTRSADQTGFNEKDKHTRLLELRLLCFLHTGSVRPVDLPLKSRRRFPHSSSRVCRTLVGVSFLVPPP